MPLADDILPLKSTFFDNGITDDITARDTPIAQEQGAGRRIIFAKAAFPIQQEIAQRRIESLLAEEI